ncbi:MAG: TIGR04372 family glycosyltransferase [Magnetococcales bacterium]|nr:TIGR04372 family glycosyltransferase [Magnetococcales bacterium]
MSKIKVFYWFQQVGRIGEIAHRIPKVRNLYPEDQYDLMLVLPARDFAETANPAVLEMVCRGVNTCFVPGIEQAQALYNQAKAEDARTVWVNPDAASTMLEFLVKFQDRPKSYHASLNEEELEKGRRLRERMGIPYNAPIVTFHVRESGYLQGMEYHDYRNANIQNYFYALIHLIKKGYWIIRLGDSSMQRLKDPPERLIDAPFHQDYEPFFEPYFIASSRFYLGMPSGPSMVAEALQVPQLMTNYPYSVLSSENPGDLFVYKKYFSQQLGRALTYEEILCGPALDFNRAYLFEDAEITVIENSPTEILAAVWEMETRLTGQYPFMAEAEVNEKWARSIQKKSHLLRQHLITKDHYPRAPCNSSFMQKGKISNEFIRLNPGFLGHRFPEVAWGFHSRTKGLPSGMEAFYRERVQGGL